MSEVQVFYDELQSSASDLADAAFVLQTDASNLVGGDAGVLRTADTRWRRSPAPGGTLRRSCR
ncbi:hypothetical protein CQ040_05225 [Microbacterium sp. MYb54]|nr:hypothetical protein CQ032_08515 [Microbacterium sp. MYb43]PQZ75762.1 hypothetical protein CQ031_14060 [Microbacterium sp. MYb40]PRB22766.1 hypothetical protein CQ040_05225 [Microbacterium sp. MYb54]PRB28892.1 hypothetical protein CQ037_08785 [Microbacterium sp. MYb50]PRB69032.1 hypothetical protein CQ021_05390 [Microbacterium sp. MYb24]PRB77219.1 hypothetical protein CQ027_05260 [Microbacterium sp. MYb32]